MIYKISIKILEESYTGINQIVQELHNSSKENLYLIDLPKLNGISHGGQLDIYVKEDFLIELKESFVYILMLDQGDIKEEAVEKIEGCLLRNKGSSLNRNSLLKFIQKNEKELSENSFQDFVREMNWTNPRPLHKQIFKSYKLFKEIDMVIKDIQKKMKDNGPYLSFTSNKNRNFFKTFFTRTNFDIIDFDSLAEKVDSYGFVKKGKRKQ